MPGTSRLQATEFEFLFYSELVEDIEALYELAGREVSANNHLKETLVGVLRAKDMQGKEIACFVVPSKDKQVVVPLRDIKIGNEPGVCAALLLEEAPPAPVSSEEEKMLRQKTYARRDFEGKPVSSSCITAEDFITIENVINESEDYQALMLMNSNLTRFWLRTLNNTVEDLDGLYAAVEKLEYAPTALLGRADPKSLRTCCVIKAKSKAGEFVACLVVFSPVAQQIVILKEIVIAKYFPELLLESVERGMHRARDTEKYLTADTFIRLREILSESREYKTAMGFNATEEKERRGEEEKAPPTWLRILPSIKKIAVIEEKEQSYASAEELFERKKRDFLYKVPRPGTLFHFRATVQQEGSQQEQIACSAIAMNGILRRIEIEHEAVHVLNTCLPGYYDRSSSPEETSNSDVKQEDVVKIGAETFLAQYRIVKRLFIQNSPARIKKVFGDQAVKALTKIGEALHSNQQNASSTDKSCHYLRSFFSPQCITIDGRAIERAVHDLNNTMAAYAEPDPAKRKVTGKNVKDAYEKLKTATNALPESPKKREVQWWVGVVGAVIAGLAGGLWQGAVAGGALCGIPGIVIGGVAGSAIGGIVALLGHFAIYTPTKPCPEIVRDAVNSLKEKINTLPNGVRPGQ